MHWLVIGYGSSIHSDDRFGLCVAEALRACTSGEVNIITGTQLYPELAEPLSRADGAIFIDATSDLPPGELECISLSADKPDQSNVAAPTGAVSTTFTHYLSPHSLLQSALALYGHAPPAWLYTVGGEEFGLGEELTQRVAAAVPEAVSLIRDRVKINP